MPEGIPMERDYRSLLRTDTFKSIERFSDDFIFKNEKALGYYMNKWVKDPLHQWSRQWEYPYVYCKIQEYIKEEVDQKILDAGSGITFFPFYLNSQFTRSTIHCCDYDKELINVFSDVKYNKYKIVEFSFGDLRSLPYKTGTFNLVYCISVLEHTEYYEQIIDEFSRIILPGGKLILTFDISLDGTRDISVDKATMLLTALSKRFTISNNLVLDLNSQIIKKGIFTTVTAKHLNVSLLPWKQKSLLNRVKLSLINHQTTSWPPPLTIFCLSLTK